MKVIIHRSSSVALAAFIFLLGLQQAAVSQTAPPTPVSPTPEVVADPVTYTFGYAYPSLWLLPLVLIAVVPLIARALTKNLEPEREQS